MKQLELNPEKRIALFQRKEIRRVIHNNEWWFVITDVIGALTDSVDPSGYIKDMRRRDNELHKGWGQIATPLSVRDGGNVAGNARRELETKSGRKVVTSENYLALTQAAKKTKQVGK